MPYLALMSAISSAIFFGLRTRQSLPMRFLRSQKVQLKGQPLVAIIVAKCFCLEKTSKYFSIGKRCLAGKGRESRFSIKGRGGVIIISLSFLKDSPWIWSKSKLFLPSNLSVNSIIVNSPSLITAKSKLPSFNESIGMEVALGPPKTVIILGSIAFILSARFLANLKLQVIA